MSQHNNGRNANNALNSASSSSINSRKIETMLLEQSHGTDPEAQAQISKILNERYSFAGSQKPFLILEGTELRQDIKENIQEKNREKKKKQANDKEMLRNTLKATRRKPSKEHDGVKLQNQDISKIPNTRGRAKIRHSRLEHARYGLKTYIQSCQKAQKQLQHQLQQKNRPKNLNEKARNIKKRTSSDSNMTIQLMNGLANIQLFQYPLSNSLDPSMLEFQQNIPVIDQFFELNNLWNEYMQDLIFNTAGDSARQNQQNIDIEAIPLTHKLSLAGKLASADYHGAKLTVISAHNPSLVGFEGIVIWEAKSSFIIIVPQKLNANSTVREKIGGLRIIEKKGTIFRFEVQVPSVDKKTDDSQENFDKEKALLGEKRKMTFEIVGSRFMYRTAERSGKKFKARSAEDLI